MRRFSLLTILFPAFSLVLPAQADEAIISEWTGAIHTLNLTHFTDWPGVDGSMAIDVSAMGDRVWLIWPHTVISLNARGMPDSKSLLSLFSSQSVSWNGGRWTPENGILSSRADWLAYLESGFRSLDLLNAEVRNIDWKGGWAEPLFAAPNGNIVALIDRKAHYVDFHGHEGVLTRLLDFHVPSVSTVSTETAKLAWLDAKGIHLVSMDEGKEKIIPLEAGALPAESPWGISWFGANLVLAYPRTIYAVISPGEEPPRVSRFEEEWLPRRWYRLRGGKNTLLVHTPETNKLRICRFEKEASIASLPIFKDFLAEHAIPAGQLLEEEEKFEAAVRYYNWTLPQVRAFRSKYPLEEVWAKLERELVERRLVLLQME